jgi:peptidylprolyl isomerase
MRLTRSTALAAALVIAFTAAGSAQRAAASRRPLTATDVNDIATLLKLEDTRQFDAAILTRLTASAHPEVKRRAITAVGRIANEQGRALLATLHGETNPELLATVAFATGQLKDPDAVAWLGEILNNSKTPPAAAKEAAQALGKIRTPAARTALAAYLASAPATAATAPVVGEALLSVGRFTTKDDLAPILRWTSARDVEVRWRAAWALFRPRDPGAVAPLLKMSLDASPEVRFWAVRGLAPAIVDQSGIDRAETSARLRQAMNDPDRRVRTEALRALTAYDDDASVAAVIGALASDDAWMSVSAAEALGRMTRRAAEVVPALVKVSGPSQRLSMRLSALLSLTPLAPDAARALAADLAKTSSATAQNAAAQAIRQIDAAAARAAQAAAGQTAPPSGRGAGGRGNAAPRPAPTARSDADYRALVTKWIVPDYNGAPRPHVVFTTARGQVDVELFPGDAPFGVEYLQNVVISGEIVGSEFGRVVPNFVAQERAIRGTGTLRDEVNRHGLLRGTLSWASSGLDTGRPGYTLGSTPQPHNEGDFTALGRVVKGLDVVDHLELGDRITAAKMR